MFDHQTPAADPLRPLADAIKRELREELIAELRAELRAAQAEAAPERIMLSLADAGRRFGIGRIELKRMIASGRLPAVERRCRGGRLGSFIHLADAERVLAGRKVSTHPNLPEVSEPELSRIGFTNVGVAA